MQIGIAAKISRTECCLRKTVDILIKTAVTRKLIFQTNPFNFLLCNPANITAKDPITWIEGHTFVLVSNA